MSTKKHPKFKGQCILFSSPANNNEEAG